jgi:hypothetical protein
MSSHLDTPSLEALARSLAGTFPRRDDAPLARALLGELARGEPVSAAALAASTHRAEHDVTQTLARWPNVRRDEHRCSVGRKRLDVSLPAPACRAVREGT